MKFLQNLFQTVTDNPINSKTALEKKNIMRPNLGGGVRGRYDRGQRFNVFFYAFPNRILKSFFADPTSTVFTSYEVGIEGVNNSLLHSDPC